MVPYISHIFESNVLLGWDLEYNKVIRHYHGHLSGVMCMALHPTLDLLITGGRDSVARVRHSLIGGVLLNINNGINLCSCII